ncbi:Rpn family recombination-promoting nuclease/putative transposase [Leptolyngbyaceae cyanobacterium CCMR0082]|uniref:Rpn family recombination-promoting nuclease/putative transposase n=1 Tax=Adonisia turfae CCMR0082 TaxID=2304604 RepID=A0A6M0S2N2_9CYAN|nr:Rpn family recombination-promoting nuclease/putative transposase [Adonisia turfae]NEZ62739.1 Rpn family recombination-promoting nuclease/putative transposase [Adonisia turfae CCMR0082]
MPFPLQERYINLLTDFGFRRVFGSEPNKPLLIDFLNTLLPPYHHIQTLAYQMPEVFGNTPIDCKAVFDLYCQGENGERFIVEIQKAKQNYFKDRSVFYASFPIQEQALKGDWNYRLAPVYSIGVLDFVFDDYKHDDTYLHTVELKNQHCEVFYDKLKFVYIELPKFQKSLTELVSHQDQWLYLLRHLPELDDRPQPFQDPVFLQLFEIAEIANFSPTEQDSYQNSLKYYRDLNNVVDTSREEGRLEGLEEGRLEQARSLILRLLTRKLGEMPQDVVEQIDRLSLVRLEALGDKVFEMTSLDDLKAWLMVD